MKTLKIIATSATFLLGATGLAVADADNGNGDQQPGMSMGMGNDPSWQMGGDHAEMMKKMMPMMMKMHARMMAGGMGMMGQGMGMMGQGGDRPGMAMMDRKVMQMMMGPGMMGKPSAKDAAATMQSRLTEFDTDGDGNLSLSEFEALHSAMIREKMVDRFQHLDADGDGAVSPAEMAAPAKRMNMRAGMKGMSTGGDDN